MNHIVILSGAGISAESGLKTFRGNDGLWEGHRIEEVATPEAWARDPAMVLDFYNMRRRAVSAAKPNAAHRYFAELEKRFRVSVITQNVDDLHERSGSTSVLHLHGLLTQARPDGPDEGERFEIGYRDIHPGDRDSRGRQLRPHIVWFGEAVPEMARASEITRTADALVIVGTSLAVYPAANLVFEAPETARVFLLDPAPPDGIARMVPGLDIIRAKATEGVCELDSRL